MIHSPQTYARIARNKNAVALVFTLLISIVVFWLVINQSLHHDIAWQFWIARQMDAGIGLYSEIIELNPPLWFWMAYLCQKVAAFTGVEATIVYKTIIVGIIFALGLTLPNLLGIKKYTDKVILFLCTLFIFCLYPINSFGQREHLLAIVALPYILLIAQRVDGKKVSSTHAVLIGFTAAFGFALKHYFLLVPIFLEIWVLYKSRKITALFRPETLTLGIMAVLYATCMVYLTPAFLDEIVPLIKLTYDGYKATFAYTLMRPHIVLWAFASIVFFRLVSNTDFVKNHYVIALLIAFSGYVLAYFLQQKGWVYHAIPASITLLCTIAYVVINQGVANLDRPLKLFLISLIVISILPVFLIQNIKKTRGFQLAPYISNQTVLILATNPGRMWPQVENQNAVWVSRYYSTWMVPKIVHAQQKASYLESDLQQAAVSIRQKMLEDIQCNPPTLIAAIRTPVIFQRQPTDMTILAFLAQSQAWQSFFTTHYHKSAETKDFDIYTPITPITPLSHQNCRVIY